MAIINYLTTIRLDFGAIAGLPEDLRATGIAAPLILTDRGVAAAGLLDRIRAALPDADAAAPVFTDTPSNPTEEAAEAALSVYRAHGCDGIVAIGGGSPMDLAKAVAVLATHEGPLQSFTAVLGGTPRITAAAAPVIAVPTTAGTGSEVGRGAVITFRDGRKLALLSPHLIPRRAVCDPELTLGLPPGLTAATGMDAVSHCIECFISPVDNPVAGAIAIDGLERATKALPRAVANGQDREARREMMIAAFEGALAFQKGLGAVHALSHPLGALREFALHHGTLNAVLLPTVLRFNAPAAGEKYDGLRRAMGLAPGADVADFVAQFSRGLGLPSRLSEMGVPRQVLPAIAKAALGDHTHATNARPATEQDYLAMLEEAF
ncbi:iron-containing alcohol dehydrogenase [Alsobacter sp. SYSU M60028]|uniref:Iron-containing alcohol dehydrogenase n=1 Tax=Alsobacter ponti TaxID=2962936 RepID=A0ABT1LIJ5_9HYPH|nr:iron-containing alcohol dehydrogenase [Alsobacter ponti]MCP8940038.1 iron-containing alcohol dehydrogenase [Alsobacter ponti]